MGLATASVEAELLGLLADFYHRYPVEGDGDRSLTARLTAQHLDPRRIESVAGGRPKPRSRPPGDTLALSLALEIGASVRYWVWKIHPTGEGSGVPYAPPPRVRGARRPGVPVWSLPLDTCVDLLPTLADGHDLAEEVRFDLRSQSGQAQIRLGLKRPPVPIRDLTCPYCSSKTIVFDPESAVGDVWCANSGPEGCHDDLQHPTCRAACSACDYRRDPTCPDCAGQAPLVLCRRSGRSQRHAFHWSHGAYNALRAGADDVLGTAT